MKKPVEERNPVARELGALGGRAGVGAAKKSRGDRQYYRELARLAVEARRKRVVSS